MTDITCAGQLDGGGKTLAKEIQTPKPFPPSFPRIRPRCEATIIEIILIQNQGYGSIKPLFILSYTVAS